MPAFGAGAPETQRAPVRRGPAPSRERPVCKSYDRLSFTSFVISNIETVLFPPNTSRSCSSALMFRFSFLSCRLFLFTYCQSFFTTSVRGSGLSPTIFASAALGCMAFMKAALGLRAVFLADFFEAAFLAAIRCFLPWGERSPLEKPAHSDRTGSAPSSDFSLWKGRIIPWARRRQRALGREIRSSEAPSRRNRSVRAAFFGAALGSHSRSCFSLARIKASPPG